MSEASPVLCTSDDQGVRTLMLSRPDKLNALNRVLIEALSAAFHDADQDGDVRALVLSGSGKAFSAGVDLKETSALKDEAEATAHAERVANLFLAVSRITKPTFAAVEGYALGGGCGLALACDFLVASETSVFGYPEIVKRVMPALVTPNLVKRVGSRKAFEFLATGKTCDADAMLSAGLANKVVGAGHALSETQNWAAEIAAHDPRILAWIKELVKESESAPLEKGLDSARTMNARARMALKPRS